MPATTGASKSGEPAESHGRAVNPFAADEHALIIAAGRVFLPSGRELPLKEPVDSVERLAEVLHQALDPSRKRKMLRPKGVTPQVWIVGIDACERLGWLPPEPDGWADLPDLQRRVALAESLTALLSKTLWPFTDHGWELRADPGPRILLTRGRAMVDLVLEPFAWIAQGSDKGNILGDLDQADADPDGEDADTNDSVDDGTAETAGAETDPTSTALPDDDIAAAAELGRRLAAAVQHLGVLPSESAGRTGASIADIIWKDRQKAGRGLVISEPGGLPEDMEYPPGPEDDLEPPLEYTRRPTLISAEDLTADEAGVVPITHLVEMDQTASYLGSCSINLGYGAPVHMSGDAAVAAVRKAWNAPKTVPLPFGLYRANLPAGQELSTPEWMPLPHPHMRADRRVSTWVTSVSVEWLCKPVADGGAGLGLDDLEIEQAWLWPSQGRALDAWTKTLREARAHFVTSGDLAMEAMVKAIYQQYIGRMKNPDMWRSKFKMHHHQPVWRAAIMATTRWRARAQAQRVYDEFGLKPLQTIVDAHIYAIGPGLDAQLPDLAAIVAPDMRNRLGQLRRKRAVPVDQAGYEQLCVDILGGTRPQDVARALAKVFKGAS
ncbi:hypothetical protein [Nocardia sp. NPDC051570]|uniref:hypothetical protein n=1 Tax=Nocardia sp. NPDC051570 TaxID=3364324 RepID=UPI0037ACB8E2